VFIKADYTFSSRYLNNKILECIVKVSILFYSSKLRLMFLVLLVLLLVCGLP